MPGWDLGDVVLQMRAFGTSDPWQDAPDTFGAPFNGKVEFRMAFYIINGSGGPIAVGDLQLEGNVDGSGYVDWIGGLFKDAQPGYTDGPVQSPPDFFQGEIDFTGYSGSTILFRVRADWETSGFSPVMTVPVATDLRGTGELDEFFRDEDHGIPIDITGDNPRRILGIFNDPSRLMLRMMGRRPTMLCEHAQVAPTAHGDPVTSPSLPGRSFLVRGKHRRTDLTTLVLEETT